MKLKRTKKLCRFLGHPVVAGWKYRQQHLIDEIIVVHCLF